MADLIFISYSSKDVSVANQVVAYLENNGFQCWIAPRNITSGGDYTDMIDDAINSCRALVLIMSSKSIQSQWVKKELATAVSYNKTIIPFRINAVQLNSGWQFLLNNVQWIDATTGSTASHFPEIISGIDQSTVDDSTEHWLDVIEESCDYKAWFCGHWHTDKRVDKMHFLFHTFESNDQFMEEYR